MNSLPDGVIVRALQRHADERGSLIESHRASWGHGAPAQFNLVVSAPGVLRGVHLHFVHTDQLVMAHGRMVVGLHDCRSGSPTFGQGASVMLEDADRTLIVPPGVAHGFWMPNGGTLVYGLDAEWTPADELRCRWDDPALKIDWSAFGDPTPTASPGMPHLSERDRSAPSLAAMLAEYNATHDNGTWRGASAGRGSAIGAHR